MVDELLLQHVVRLFRRRRVLFVPLHGLEVFNQALPKLLRLERLADAIVHAVRGVEAFVVAHNVGGHRYDRHVRVLFKD
jgi:hypothetical protein